MYPHINYAIEVYGSCCKTTMKSLQVTQNNLLRVLNNVGYRSSATHMHNELGLKKIVNIYETAVLIFVHKQRNNLLPEVFKEYYHNVRGRSMRSSRQNNNLYVEFARTSFGTKSLKIIGAKLWNIIPTEIKEVQGIHKFKHLLKKYMKTVNSSLI